MFRRYDKDLIKKLKELDKQKYFPHEDIQLIQEENGSRIPDLEEKDRLVEDFDKYQSLIDGSLSYILARRYIPDYQKQYLYKSFFSSYPVYKFLEEELEDYPDFKKELKLYESTREILIKF